MGHFWLLGVEEQVNLLWPVADRLLGVCFALIATGPLIRPQPRRRDGVREHRGAVRRPGGNGLAALQRSLLR
jgi:hypothetical protein